MAYAVWLHVYMAIKCRGCQGEIWLLFHVVFMWWDAHDTVLENHVPAPIPRPCLYSHEILELLLSLDPGRYRCRGRKTKQPYAYYPTVCRNHNYTRRFVAWAWWAVSHNSSLISVITAANIWSSNVVKQRKEARRLGHTARPNISWKVGVNWHLQTDRSSPWAIPNT